MGVFKLLAGIHIQADSDWEPTEEEKAFAEKTGKPLRAPSKTYKEGDKVESETDLEQRFGYQKFQRLDKPKGSSSSSSSEEEKKKSRLPADVSPESLGIARAPQGQISTGFQTVSSKEDGSLVHGYLTGEEAKERGVGESSESSKKESASPPPPSKMVTPPKPGESTKVSEASPSPKALSKDEEEEEEEEGPSSPANKSKPATPPRKGGK